MTHANNQPEAQLLSAPIAELRKEPTTSAILERDRRIRWASQIECLIPVFGLRHLEPALVDGDVEAAHGLYCAVKSRDRGDLALALWRARMPVPAFRTVLAAAWDHEHRELINAARCWRVPLRELFRYAAFEIPAGTPEIVTVWRGTSALCLAEARRGYSWTTNRDVACWFAMRFVERNGQPLVLRADVHRLGVALFHDGRGEHEVVVLDARRLRRVELDGCPEDWQQGFARYSSEIAEHRRALTSEH